METQQVNNSSKTVDIHVSPKNQQFAPSHTANSLVILILLIIFSNAIIFGFGGYYLGIYTSTQQRVNQNQQVSFQKEAIQPTPMDKEMKTFRDTKIGVEFQYSSEFVLDPHQSPHFYDNDPLHKWLVVLKNKTGNDELRIQNGGPADWGDCKKRLDEKTITGDVTLHYFKETISTEPDCASGEGYIGWFATATKGEDSWFISLTTTNAKLENQQFLEPLFFDVITSFKTI